MYNGNIPGGDFLHISTFTYTVFALLLLILFSFFLVLHYVLPAVPGNTSVDLLVVPERQIFAGQASAPVGTVSFSPEEKLNINTASEDLLSDLPGIGETLARAIVQFRNDTGGFSSIEELMHINGIGQTRFDKIAPYITAD